MRFWIINRVLNKLAFFVPGGYSLRPRLQRLRGAKLGKNVWISQYVYFDELHPEVITIGDNCTIGIRTSIISHLYWGPRQADNGHNAVLIEKDVFVGPHCLILPGTHIGEGTVIKGGSVVSGKVPPHTLWGPQPAEALARVTVPLTPEHGYDRFLRGIRPFRKT